MFRLSSYRWPLLLLSGVLKRVSWLFLILQLFSLCPVHVGQEWLLCSFWTSSRSASPPLGQEPWEAAGP